jgi:hypothetical protein
MTTSRLFPLRIPFVLALLGGLLAAPSASGTPAPNQSPADPPTLIKHLQNDLQGPDSAKRQAALIDIIALANCTSTCTIALQSVDEKRIRIENASGKGAVVDLTALVPDLLNTYRTGPADGHRLLALSALLHIGNQSALEQLIDESARQSDGVKQATHRNLAGFYLTRYPELEENVTRTRTLSIEDVWRAEALRVRAARKQAQR